MSEKRNEKTSIDRFFVKNPKQNDSSGVNTSNENASAIPTFEPDILQQNSSSTSSVIEESEPNEQIAETNENQVDQISTATSTLINKVDFHKECKECIESFEVRDKNDAKLRYVRCNVCMAFPNIVKMNTDNRKPPPITTSEGAS